MGDFVSGIYLKTANIDSRLFSIGKEMGDAVIQLIIPNMVIA